jgi:hypothetical protein
MFRTSSSGGQGVGPKERLATNKSFQIIRNSSVASEAEAELSPVAAIVGGQLAQDILKVVSGKDAPINNFFCFDGDRLAGHQHRLPPQREKKGNKQIETIDLDDD